MPDTITIEMVYREAPEIRRIVKHAEMIRNSGKGDPRYNVWDHYSALKLEGEKHVGWYRTGEGPGWMRNDQAHGVFIRALCDALEC